MLRVQAKIDEEMAKIVVDVGVYLPSNPDGVVIDIDKKSGRPLQSHAKVRINPSVTEIDFKRTLFRRRSWRPSKSASRRLLSARTPTRSRPTMKAPESGCMMSGSKLFSRSEMTVAKMSLLYRLLLCLRTSSPASVSRYTYTRTVLRPLLLG